MELGYLYRPAFGAGTLLVLLILMRISRRLWLPADDGAASGDRPNAEGRGALATATAVDGASQLQSPHGASLGALAQPHLAAGERSSGRRNLALGLVQCGNVLGLSLIAGAVVEGGAMQRGLLADVGWVGLFGLTSSLLLWAGGRFGVRMIVQSSLPAEIGRGNVAAGVVAAAHMVATAIILSRCIYGTDLLTLGVALGFFALAQITLHLFVLGFRALTAYDDAEEIRNENLAAAMSYAGVTIALGIIIARATDGSFTGWGSSLAAYGRSLLYALVLYPIRQIVVQALLLRGGWSLRRGELDRCIAPSRDICVGLLEAFSYVGAALVLARIG